LIGDATFAFNLSSSTMVDQTGVTSEYPNVSNVTAPSGGQDVGQWMGTVTGAPTTGAITFNNGNSFTVYELSGANPAAAVYCQNSIASSGTTLACTPSGSIPAGSFVAIKGYSSGGNMGTYTTSNGGTVTVATSSTANEDAYFKTSTTGSLTVTATGLTAASAVSLSLTILPPSGGASPTPSPGPTSSYNPTTIANDALWLDANDNSTITAASGAVSQWNDKSGNALNVAQSTSADRPTTATMQGHGAMAFNTQWLDSSTATLTGTAFSVFYVGSFGAQSNAGGGYAAVIGMSSGASGIDVGMSGTTTVTQIASYPGAALKTASTVVTQNAPGIFGYMSDGGTGVPAFDYDGTMETTTAQTIVTATANTYIGDTAPGGGRSFTGMLGEMLVYNRAVTSTERQKIEGYLACKWALQSTLPSGHPYKTACP
jgi:hypothetical protein